MSVLFCFLGPTHSARSAFVLDPRSKFGANLGLFANWATRRDFGLARREFNRKDFEEVEHFPAEQEDRDDHGADRQNLSKAHAVVLRFEALGNQAEDVERSEAEDQRPEDVVDVAPLVGGFENGNGTERCERGDMPLDNGDHLRAGELADQG
jgi:hypothetical protein